MKNIAIINRDKNTIGGQEKISQYLANEISIEHNVTFITTRSKFDLSILNKEINVFSLNNILNFLGEIFFYEAFSKKFKKYLSKFDILIINNPFTLFAFEFFLLKNKNQKVITIFHSKSYSSGFIKKIINKIKMYLLLQISALKSEVLVFLTNEDKFYFDKKIIFKKNLLYRTIHNGINVKDFNKSKKINNKKIIFVGKLTKSKGVNDLFLVAKKMPEFDFTFIGSGKLKSKLKNLKNVKILSNLNQKSISNEYKKHNIFILPSYSESFPLSIVEAMSSGLYIISSDIFGLSEIIKPSILGNTTIKPGRIEEIINKIKEINSNKKLLNRTREKNYIYAQKEFSIKNMGRKYLNIIKEIK